MSIPIKRVVTGVDGHGKSVCYEDKDLPPVELALMPGVQMFQAWGTEGPVASPVIDPAPANDTFFPGAGGTRFGIFRFPPESVPDPDAPAADAAALEAGAAEAEEKVPGLLGVFEPDAPGMHQTKTVDYAIVLEGEMALELDDAVLVPLPVGTCVVQNGARHGWRNTGSAPATLGYVIVAAV